MRRDIGGDVERRDRLEAEPPRLTPSEKLPRSPRVRHPRPLVRESAPAKNSTNFPPPPGPAPTITRGNEIAPSSPPRPMSPPQPRPRRPPASRPPAPRRSVISSPPLPPTSPSPLPSTSLSSRRSGSRAHAPSRRAVSRRPPPRRTAPRSARVRPTPPIGQVCSFALMVSAGTLNRTPVSRACWSSATKHAASLPPRHGTRPGRGAS